MGCVAPACSGPKVTSSSSPEVTWSTFLDVTMTISRKDYVVNLLEVLLEGDVVDLLEVTWLP